MVFSPPGPRSVLVTDERFVVGTPALGVHANARSGPILRRLGFEQVLQFRRLQDVPSVA